MTHEQEMDARVRALDIEWHCPGRHGVVRNVPRSNGEIVATLEYFYGHGCCHFDGKAIEFVHMTKVSPPPRKPWEWCGETVLFNDWKSRLDANRSAAQTFQLGDTVSFDHRGATITGLVISIGRTGRIGILDQTTRQKWTCPAGELREGNV